MKYYPINLDIKNRNALVVGGGGVGTRKVETLLKCGASVTVVSLEASSEVKKLASQKKIILRERAYQSSDLNDIFLVICATNNSALNRQVAADAESRKILCNIADVPDLCNFILPAIVERGDLVITISTGGASPAFAKNLRKKLEKDFGEEYAEFLLLMGNLRKKRLAEGYAPKENKKIFQELVKSDLLNLIRDKKRDEANKLLVKIAGAGYDIL